MSDTKTNYKKLTVEEQAKRIKAGLPILYRMRIRFLANASVTAIDEILSMTGEPMRIISKDAIALYMEQTVPFIPDDEILEQYATILQKGYEATNITLHKTHFDSYEYLYAVMTETKDEAGSDNIEKS